MLTISYGLFGSFWFAGINALFLWIYLFFSGDPIDGSDRAGDS